MVKKRLSGGTISRKSSTPASNVNARVQINQPRGRNNVEKEGRSSSSLKGQSVSKQLVSSSKKGWGNRLAINLKALNSFTPYSDFKKEGLHLLKDLLRERLYVQGEPERGLLLCSFAQKSSNISSISMDVKHLRVLVSVFWSGSSTSDFHKIIKVSHRSFEADSNQNNHLSGRHVADESDCKLSRNRSILPQEKVKKLRLKCQKLISNPRTTLWEVASLLGSLCSTAQPVLPAMLQISFL